MRNFIEVENIESIKDGDLLVYNGKTKTLMPLDKNTLLVEFRKEIEKLYAKVRSVESKANNNRKDIVVISKIIKGE